MWELLAVEHTIQLYCKQRGIQMEWTNPYTPEQNGTSERMNRTLVEKARSMLEDKSLDKKLWGVAVQTAAYRVSNQCCRSGRECFKSVGVYCMQAVDVCNHLGECCSRLGKFCKHTVKLSSDCRCRCEQKKNN